MLRAFVLLTAAAVCGCHFSDQSRWESTVTASTKVHTDGNNPVDAVDLSATLRRNW